MRKHSFVGALLPVTILVAAWAMLLTSGLPLPWRGGLTRLAYVDLVRGRLPMLACARRTAFATYPGTTCHGLARDSLHGVEVFVRGRRVVSLAHVWWRDVDAAPALVDSLVHAVSATRGPAMRCPPRQPGNAGGFTTQAFLWHGDRGDGSGVLVRVTRRVQWSNAGPEGWAVSLRRRYGPMSCDLDR